MRIPGDKGPIVSLFLQPLGMGADHHPQAALANSILPDSGVAVKGLKLPRRPPFNKEQVFLNSSGSLLRVLYSRRSVCVQVVLFTCSKQRREGIYNQSSVSPMGGLATTYTYYLV